MLLMGINEYKVISIAMKDKDGDKIYNDIVNKISNGIGLTRQDIVSLTFNPIMGGNTILVDRILNAIHIVKNIDMM